MSTKTMSEIRKGDTITAIGPTTLQFPVTVTQAMSGDGGRNYFMRGTITRPDGSRGTWLPTGGVINAKTTITVA